MQSRCSNKNCWSYLRPTEQSAFVFLDRPGTSLGNDLIDTYLEIFRQRNISYVVFEERGGSLAHFDYMLELDKGGAWVCRPVGDDHRLQNDIPCTP